MRNAELLRYLILAAQREGNRQLTAGLRVLELTPSQAEVIRVVGEFEPCSLRRLGELLVCESGGSPSRLVDRLVNAGQLHRQGSSSDRRQITLSLTHTGAELNERIKEIEDQFYQQVDRSFSDVNGLTATIETLEKVLAGSPAGNAVTRREAAHIDALIAGSK